MSDPRPPGRNLVVFSDGTNSDAGSVLYAQQQLPGPTDAVSNVFRLWQACPDLPGQQETFYDPGLGAKTDAIRRVPIGRPLYRLLSWTTGYGISMNILDCYDFLVSFYEPGDRIFLIGFSRGAYTVRSLGGMLSCAGIVRRYQNGRDLMQDPTQRAKLCKEALAVYQTRDDTRRAELGKQFRAKYSEEAAAFTIGVWDTVRALGIPGGDQVVQWIGRRVERLAPHKFHDDKLGKKVRYAFQALSLDENRKHYEPVIWDTESGVENAVPGQTIEQAWLPGVHSDIGGAYPDEGRNGRDLGRLTLAWMVDRLTRPEIGLIVEHQKLDITPANAQDWMLGPGHDERASVTGKLWPVGYRVVDPECLLEPGPPRRIKDGTVAKSVLTRCEKQSSYRPVPLKDHGLVGEVHPGWP